MDIVVRHPCVIYSLPWRDIDALACVSQTTAGAMRAVLAQWVQRANAIIKSCFSPVGQVIFSSNPQLKKICATDLIPVDRYEAELVHSAIDNPDLRGIICTRIMANARAWDIVTLVRRTKWFQKIDLTIEEWSQNVCYGYNYVLLRPKLPASARLEVKFEYCHDYSAESRFALTNKIIQIAEPPVLLTGSQEYTTLTCVQWSNKGDDYKKYKTIVINAIGSIACRELLKVCAWLGRRKPTHWIKLVILVIANQIDENCIIHRIASSIFCTSMYNGY